ncbi:sulfatase-like hydrolase/transferase [Paraflavisolibacter sp. H34]|uniref:sulfatase-like hydrolase/transferase n=1 Tax=Huijunlia imazamoxiresistens TaxID=3127457 RepID=UPI00301B6480
MKRIISFFALLSLAASLALLCFFNYHWTVPAYHLLVMALVYGGLFLLNAGIALFVGHRPTRSALLYGVNGLFFFSLTQFYLLMLGSNFFWNKTITLPILGNYFFSLPDFIGIMPVEKWISGLLLLLYLGLLAALFGWLRPRPDGLQAAVQPWKQPANRKKSWMAATGLLVLAVLFHQQLWALKRVMHFAEEPLLEFTLGEMWGKENDLAFDRVRYQKGLNDRPCIDSVRPNTQSGRSIILILADALRSDHLPFYGYDRQTAPFLDSLYRQQKLQVVKNAFSPSTMTIGGISGLFFSRSWNEFGYNGLSLMKFMKLSGYRTYAFLTGFHRDWYGLSALYRGNCDYYYESSKNPRVQNDDDLQTLQEFRNTPLPANSFVYLHLLSTHMLGKRNQPFRKFLPDKIGLTTGKETALVNNYDNGVLQADYVIRQVFDHLKQQNLLQNATVFIVADHGELFGENNAWRHGGSVHEKLISVPLLIYDQDRDWYKNLEGATLLDVAPTVAERIQSPVPGCWQGRSLHAPPADFELEINSVEACSQPYGTLSKTGDVYHLSIRNNEKTVERVVEKRKDIWHPVSP